MAKKVKIQKKLKTTELTHYIFKISKSKVAPFAATLGWNKEHPLNAAEFIQQFMDGYVDGRIARAENRKPLFIPGVDKFKGV